MMTQNWEREIEMTLKWDEGNRDEGNRDEDIQNWDKGNRDEDIEMG